MKYAVQLYSLREIAKRDGAEKIFKMAAEAGYDGVEFAGFYGKTPKEIHALLNKYNLIGISAHILPQDVEKNISYIEKLGIKFVFNPWVDLEVFETPTKYAELVDITNKAKMMLDSHGVVLGYHNHSQEFNNGNNYVKKLTDDILGLKAELDVFWAYVANRDPMEEMKALKEKLVFVHIKEAAKENARESAQPIIGEGAINMSKVFEEAKNQGIEWAVLEVEKFPCEENKYLARSLKNMKRFSK